MRFIMKVSSILLINPAMLCQVLYQSKRVAYNSIIRFNITHDFKQLLLMHL